MSAFALLPISRRLTRVWSRNYRVYRKTWRVSVLPPLLEPLLYILAFGYGLSALVGNVTWRGAPQHYGPCRRIAWSRAATSATAGCSSA